VTRGNQGIMERPCILLGPTIIIGLDDADAVGADRGQQGKKSLGTHRDGDNGSNYGPRCFENCRSPC
jgi:hypothetical protein